MSEKPSTTHESGCGLQSVDVTTHNLSKCLAEESVVK